MSWSEGTSESHGKAMSDNLLTAPKKSRSNKGRARNYAGKWLDRANAYAEHVDLVPVSLDLERARRSLIVHMGLRFTLFIAVLLNRLTLGGRQHVKQLSLGRSHSGKGGGCSISKGRNTLGPNRILLCIFTSVNQR